MRSFAIAFIALVGCTNDHGERVAPVRQAVSALEQRAQGEIIVDLNARGDALAGRTLPVPPDSDADRTMLVRWVTPTGERPWRFQGTPVLEARFASRGEAVIVVTTEHTLVRLATPMGEPTVIDRDAQTPLSLDAFGDVVVYTRGEAPTVTLARAEIATGRVEALAPELAPSWCPTVSADGREIIVVASPEGTPSLWRIREGAPAARWELPQGTALPTGPSAPVLFGDAFVYESDGALYTLGLDGTPRKTLPHIGLPVYVPGAPAMLAHDAHGALVTLRPRDLEAP